MAKLMYFVIALLIALIAITEARNGGCRSGMKFRPEACRNVFGMFKRLLDDMDKEEAAGDEDERNLGPKGDPEADLRALLYGQEPAERPEVTEQRTVETTSEDEDLKAEKRERQIRKYELEMELIEELLRDLENADLDNES